MKSRGKSNSRENCRAKTSAVRKLGNAALRKEIANAVPVMTTDLANAVLVMEIAPAKADHVMAIGHVKAVVHPSPADRFLGLWTGTGMVCWTQKKLIRPSPCCDGWTATAMED